MALTTTSTLSSVMKAYYDKRFLNIAEKTYVYKQLGQIGVVPRNEGKTVVWNRYTLPTAKITALGEGTDPTPAGLSATLISATISQYGNFEQITDLLSLTSIDNSIASAVDLLGREAALTVDKLIYDIVAATTSVYYGSGVANRTSLIPTNVATVADIRTVVKKLKANEAKPMASKGAFMATINTDVAYDLEGDTNWVTAVVYTANGVERLYNGEVGKLYGVKFLETNQNAALTNSGSAGTDVYQSLFFGEQAFGISELQGLTTYVDSPSPRSALRLYSDVGWKAGFCAKILNENFMYSLETSATA